MPIEITTNERKLQQDFALLPGELAKGFKRAANKTGRSYLAHHKRLRLSGPPGIRGTSKGLLRKGNRGAFTKGKSIDELTLKIFIRGKIPKWFEHGITLRPHGRFLAIPLPDAQTKGGRTKASLRKYVKGQRRKIGDPESKLVVIRSHSGELFLALPYKQKSKPPRLLFKLVRSVTIKPVLKFFETFRAWRSQATKIYREGIAPALRSVIRRRAG